MRQREGGVVQSVCVSPEFPEDIQVIVKDFDCDGDTSNPNIHPDENGDMCEWYTWDTKNLETLTDQSLIEISKTKE